MSTTTPFSTTSAVPLSAAELLARYALEERDRKDIQLKGHGLRGLI